MRNERRRGHSAVSPLAVIGNFVVRAQGAGNPPDWLTYAPLPPLALLLLTGLYLFVQPYLRRPAARRAPGAPVLPPV